MKGTIFKEIEKTIRVITTPPEARPQIHHVITSVAEELKVS